MLPDDILNSGVLKPARYIGREWNSSQKEFDQAEVRFALCFPDLYEVGMSNLGIRILYDILNRMDGICCERFFSCAQDMRDALIARGASIVSLESGRPLGDFDLAGFSLAYELSYTNCLEILELAGIPFLASERDRRFPLVIGGGPCTMNPEPMHEFFDAFVIGEAEEAAAELVSLYRQFKQAYRSGEMSKEELLVRLAGIEGVYVPALYEVSYTQDGFLESFRPRSNRVPARIKKRVLKDFSSAFFPSRWVTPYIQVVHDRITVEVMRGCPNRCRFCQARQQYYPLRVRPAHEVLKLAADSYASSGYEEVALGGLSVSDYPGIEDLLKQLIGFFKRKGVGVSLPSIKPRTMVGELSSLIATIKKTGLTFAPEAATERLRLLLGKDFNTQDFFAALEQAYRSGYQHVKLYFMIGLPTENTEDLQAILSFANQVSDLKRTVSRRGPAQVNISVNTLIPKPHTPFQWLGMETVPGIIEKQSFLKARLRGRRLKINFHNPRMTYLEGVLSRGDRRLSRVILAAYRRQARFDAWEDHFDPEKWLDAFREAQVDPEPYLKAREKHAPLPWEFIDVGVPRDVLLAESP